MTRTQGWQPGCIEGVIVSILLRVRKGQGSGQEGSGQEGSGQEGSGVRVGRVRGQGRKGQGSG